MAKKRKTRIAGCPHCLKPNEITADVWKYRCGHCGKPIDGTPPDPHPTTGKPNPPSKS